jgi:hypothetical protein
LSPRGRTWDEILKLLEQAREVANLSAQRTLMDDPMWDALAGIDELLIELDKHCYRDDKPLHDPEWCDIDDDEYDEEDAA